MEVCDAYRDAEGRMLLNANLGFEIAHERQGWPDDEPAGREKFAAMKAKRTGG